MDGKVNSLSNNWSGNIACNARRIELLLFVFMIQQPVGSSGNNVLHKVPPERWHIMDLQTCQNKSSRGQTEWTFKYKNIFEMRLKNICRNGCKIPKTLVLTRLFFFFPVGI